MAYNKTTQRTNRKEAFTLNKRITTILIALSICATAALTTACSDNTVTAPERTGLTETKITSEPEKAHFLIKDRPADNPSRTTYTKDGEMLNVLEIEELSITQHERVDKPAADKMRDVLLTQAEKRLNNLYDSSSNALFTEMSSESFDTSTLPHKIAVDYTCIRNDGRAISITETINSYAADVLQHSTMTAFNFVPLTGEHINQIFYVSGDSNSYNDADNTMYEKLVKKYGEDVINYNNVSASFVDVATDCWYFTQDGDGIKVTFSAGRIASKDAGDLEIEYSKEELPEFAQKYFN